MCPDLIPINNILEYSINLYSYFYTPVTSNGWKYAPKTSTLISSKLTPTNNIIEYYVNLYNHEKNHPKLSKTHTAYACSRVSLSMTNVTLNTVLNLKWVSLFLYHPLILLYYCLLSFQSLALFLLFSSIFFSSCCSHTIFIHGSSSRECMFCIRGENKEGLGFRMSWSHSRCWQKQSRAFGWDTTIWDTGFKKTTTACWRNYH